MRILLLTDKPNWAYHSIAQSLIKYNPYSDVKLKIMHIKGNESAVKKEYKKFDRVLVMGWQTYERVNFLPKKITSVGIHSFHSWDEKKTTPNKDVKPPKKLIRYLSSFSSVNAVSLRLVNLFNKHGLDNVFYTPNGVDTDIFQPIVPVPINRTLVVGYSGSKAHDWRKGVSKYILPSAKKSNVRTKIAMLSTDKYISLDKMYKFYNELDCYICASSSEGMSLSVLEAASCGRPIITTRVSGCTEIIREGKTGFFVNRSISDISDKINRMKDYSLLKEMSYNIRKDIVENWCWSLKSKKWIEFLIQ